MNSFRKDYHGLYQLQNKFLSWWATLQLPFYLTGGTALGRLYLNHRYSEDLDFFVNADPGFPEYISIIRSQITGQFNINLETTLFSDDFTRLMIAENNTFLKIEFVNDVAYHSGEVKSWKYGFADTPLNILSNKLTALTARDEPKDIFDVVTMAHRYHFNWIHIFQEAKRKTVINEIDVEERLVQFPVEWLKNIDWALTPVNPADFKHSLNRLADDFLLGKDNSLCTGNCPEIENAPMLPYES